MLLFLFKGSGSLAAMAVFEDRYKPDMEVRTRVTHMQFIPNKQFCFDWFIIHLS